MSKLNMLLHLLILLSIMLVLLSLSCYCLAGANLTFHSVSYLELDDLFFAFGLFPFRPVKEYTNSDLEKQCIFAYNNNKSGIYC